MSVSILPHHDVRYLDPLLRDSAGVLQVVPASVYAGIPHQHLQIWTHLNACYGLPTTELVDFIQQVIHGRSAIEIGSGNGVLGKALGIPCTDLKAQEIPEVRALYIQMKQPTIRYGAHVEHLEALAAVRKYKPRVVVGSWVTQVSDGSRQGAVFGVDEEALLRQVETYILFGSLRNHGDKAICRRPHKVLQQPWMRSRADDAALFIWGAGA